MPAKLAVGPCVSEDKIRSLERQAGVDRTARLLNAKLMHHMDK